MSVPVGSLSNPSTAAFAAANRLFVFIFKSLPNSSKEAAKGWSSAVKVAPAALRRKKEHRSVGCCHKIGHDITIIDNNTGDSNILGGLGKEIRHGFGMGEIDGI